MTVRQSSPVEEISYFHISDWPDYTSSESDTDSEVEPIVGGQQGPATPDLQHSPQSSPPASPREGALPGDRSVVHGGACSI